MSRARLAVVQINVFSVGRVGRHLEHERDVQLLRRHAETYLPDLLGDLAQAEVCMYTNTPDLHFIFDKHPRHENVLVVSACSGHGFKFASAIGEAAAQWAKDGTPRIDMSLFALRRFRSRKDR